jgi:hypothetical protein
VTGDFLLGVLVGAVGMLVIGRLFQEILWAVLRFFLPQTATHRTAQTPYEVLVGCLGAIVRLLFIVGIPVAAWLLWKYFL